jgi:hypothetical protein
MARCFDPYDRTLNFQESQRTPKSPFRECECHRRTPAKWGCNTQALGPMLWCQVTHPQWSGTWWWIMGIHLLANGGRNLVDYIVGSPAVWQVVTHLEVIIDDTCYCTLGGNSNHRSLRLWLSIDCSFVEPQHMVITKNNLPRFKYDKSKVEEY